MTLAEGECGTADVPCIVESSSAETAWLLLAQGLTVLLLAALLMTSWGSDS